MKYRGQAIGRDAELSIEREGLRYAGSFLDYADLKAIRPINHRVFIDTLSGDTLEISMLGFSYDGFLNELVNSYSDRCIEALFIEEQPIMRCEGEYELPAQRGRGTVLLLPDAICILPPTCSSVRIPLCFTEKISLDGYVLNIVMQSGVRCSVGRMGYDTKPFAERAVRAAELTKKKRAQAAAKIKIAPPFTHCGLFRTEQPELYWLAAIGDGRCAIELFTGDDAATYLYRFSEPAEVFLKKVSEAMEAVGVHREIIFMTDEQLSEKPLYRMTVARSEAVRFLRGKSDGRLIHSSAHERKLTEYLNG